MQGTILIIEDDRVIIDLLTACLSREGFEVSAAESAEEGFIAIAEQKPELILLDISLPGMDGLEFLQKLRKFSNIPVIILSGKDSNEDQISGLNIGADEYITKPFAPKVLVANIRALLRRAENNNNQKNGFRFGPFFLDFDACILKKNDKKIPLAAKEYDVLTWLTKHPGKTTDIETIYENVWGNFGDISAVAVYISRLRKKIEDDPENPIYLESVYGKGYRLNIENI